MTNVLVTGGAGYIGSHVCKALAGAGYLPVTFDNLSAGHRWAVKWGPLVVGDLGNPGELSEAFTRYKPAAVAHLAAYSDVADSVSSPGKFYGNNVANSLTLLEALHRSGTRNLLFSSTCAVYGVPDRMPVTEQCDLTPVSPYGRSKMMTEQMIEDFGRAYGLRSVVFRYFNAAGADRDAEIGELREPEPRLIPSALRAAAGDRPYFELFGTDYSTPDGTCIRDFIHVADIAAAHVAGLAHLLQGGSSATLNLGSGKGFSVKEILSSVERVTGRQVPVRLRGRRAGDPPALVADSSGAEKLLNFAPSHDIDVMVQTAWHWYKSSVRASAIDVRQREATTSAR
jgi:UDP-glucose-4-epimerase GalE